MSLPKRLLFPFDMLYWNYKMLTRECANMSKVIDLSNIIEMIDKESRTKEEYEILLDWAVQHDKVPELYYMTAEVYKLCAENHMAAAYNNLGACYYVGKGVEQDYVKAAQYYEMAADEGVIQAYNNLGYCYYYGRHQETNYRKAFEYFSLGAAIGNHGNCYYKLGDMYRDGLYVERNPKLAFRLYCIAMNTDRASRMDYYPDIMYRIGKCWFEGVGTEKDLNRALEYLAIARSGYVHREEDEYNYITGRIKETDEMIQKILQEA